MGFFYVRWRTYFLATIDFDEGALMNLAPLKVVPAASHSDGLPGQPIPGAGGARRRLQRSHAQS